MQHLRLWYAQSHPDEDFAETFAVWLQPRSDWRRRYAGWPALKKLEYVDELMAEIADAAPARREHARAVEPLAQLRRRSREHYAEKREQLHGELSRTIYDRDLRRLFSDEPRAPRPRRARVAFLRRNRGEIRRTRRALDRRVPVHARPGARRHDRPLPRAAAARRGPERQLLIDFAVLLTVQTMHFLYSGRETGIAL